MSIKSMKLNGSSLSDEMTSGIRMRTGIMVLISSGAVAIAFGMSFYFALISSQTAVVSQFPELAPIVQRLKGMLVLSTAGFVAVIIASFWILTRLISSKMFMPLGIVMAGLKKAAENRYPETEGPVETGPFGEFEKIWNVVLSETRDRERREIEILGKCLDSLTGPQAGEARKLVSELRDEKERRICSGGSQAEKAASGTSSTDDEVFMQPV
jgi:hypothetical protein